MAAERKGKFGAVMAKSKRRTRRPLPRNPQPQRSPHRPRRPRPLPVLDVRPVGAASSPSPSVGDGRSSDQDGRRDNSDGGKLGVQNQSGRAGGFVTKKDKLTHVLLQSGIDMTAPQMLKRVNLMDSQAQSLQVIAEKLQMSLNDTSEYDEVKRLTDEYGKILTKFQKQVDGLGRTQ